MKKILKPKGNTKLCPVEQSTTSNRYKWIFPFLLVILLQSGLGCQNAPKETDNANYLPKGWEGDAQYFRMQDGAIVAGNLQRPIPNNEFLCTEKSYRDFQITLKARLIGEGKNAGVQFRSIRIPDHYEVIGYQCDIGESPERSIWGSLYDESRRKEFLAHPPAENMADLVKTDDWNEFKIVVEGPRIQIWLNGIQTVDYTEAEANIEQEGKICLQIHSGPPAEAWYKDIVITEL